MDTCIIATPLGFTKIEGDSDGICAVTVLNTTEAVSKTIPESLQDSVLQLQDYFKGTLQNFNLKLNPKGTEFQKKVWQALIQIPTEKQFRI